MVIRLSTCMLVLLITGCSTNTLKKDQMKNKNSQAEKAENSSNDTIPKVTGIGGIFFFSDNPEEIKKWYGKNLGLAISEYGSSFEFRNANRPDEINYLQWSPFRTGNAYFLPSKKEFMINYRVQNIEGLVKKLKANGVTVVDTIEAYDYGKFVHIMDPDGNKIELWEPVDSVFTVIGGKTTK
jgi:predicted enzyme related to lactoylglutathione lyase